MGSPHIQCDRSERPIPVWECKIGAWKCQILGKKGPKLSVSWISFQLEPPSEIFQILGGKNPNLTHVISDIIPKPGIFTVPRPSQKTSVSLKAFTETNPTQCLLNLPRNCEFSLEKEFWVGSQPPVLLRDPKTGLQMPNQVWEG